MQIGLKRCLWIGVITVGLGITGAAPRMMASTPQEHQEPYYTRNKNYQQGMKNGHDDFQHNREHYKTKKFKNDEDQKAYDAGYQGGHHK
jgi:hypothetical protein